MENLQQGDFSYIPGLETSINSLSEDQKKELLASFKSIDSWDISVETPRENKVSASVDFTMGNLSKTINFIFNKNDKKWILQNEVTFSQDIEFVPYAGEVIK